MTVGVAGCLAVACLALLASIWLAGWPPPRGVAASASSAGAPPEPSEPPEPPPAGIEAAAAESVRAWLAEALPATTRTVAVAPGAVADSWTATVAAESGETTLHLAVTVAGADGGSLVTSAPWFVPPPAARRPEPPDESRRVPTSHPVWETAAGFLGAYQGTGDLHGWVGPGVDVAPLRLDTAAGEVVDLHVTGALPPEDPANDTTATVLATVLTPAPSGAAVELVYPLTLSGRDGRWEVTGLPGAITVGAERDPDTGRNSS
jgi:hypothetical protein